MRRIHAIEFGDLTWFPKSFRDFGTNYIQLAANTFDLYKCVIPIIKKAMERSATTTIVDIASGGGGGLLKIAGHLKKSIPRLKIILTDYYPNTDAFKRTRDLKPDVFEYVVESVNAMDFPTYLKGLRTQFASLHHFRPKDATAILQNAIDSNQAIAIFEPQQRDVKNLARLLFSPVAVFLMAPFMKPLKINQMFFTYLIPVLPLITLWDGVISVLRTYTVTELEQMVFELRNKECFDWEVGIAKGKQNEVLYLLGTPKK